MKNFKILSFLIILLFNLSNTQYLKIDSYKDATCTGEPLYSSHYILLNNCVGNYIYKYVSDNVGGASTTSGATTAGSLTNQITTAGTLSTVDITSIVTQAVTLGMTSTGGASGILTGLGGLNVNNLQQSVGSEIQTAESQTSATGAQTQTTLATETSNIATSGDDAQSTLGAEPQTTSATTTTSNPLTSLSSNAATTTSNPLTSLSGLNTLSGLSSGLTQVVTQAITNVISSSLTTGTNTGNVQTGAGKVVQYYCLSIGCGAQCVSLVEYPIATCTKLGLDNVVYSVVNETNLVMKADDTTSPDSNGFCQSFVTQNSACVSSSFSDITQYKNDYCGKGLKINCTTTKYNTFTCIDSNCDDCVLLKQYDLDKCIIQNSTGTTFKSVLKTNITDPVTLPPLSSESIDSHHSSSSYHSNATSKFNFNLLLLIINISIISIILL